MPLPFILGGLGLLAGAIGIGGHLDAKDKNESAQWIYKEAQKNYDSAKVSFEQTRKKMENSLVSLGKLKMDVLNGIMKKFIILYKPISAKICNNIIKDGTKEVLFNEHDIKKLEQMTSMYSSAIDSGMGSGALITLAASGLLVGTLQGSMAASGTAATLALLGGKTASAAALSLGAAVTPLAAIAAPVMFFTGLSASFKADENLEKAEKAGAESKAAVEEMKLKETMYNAIKERAEIHYQLLEELEPMFSECVKEFEEKLKSVGYKAFEYIGKCSVECERKRKCRIQNECDLAYTSSALAAAVGTVIFEDILDREGNLKTMSPEFLKVSEEYQL